MELRRRPTTRQLDSRNPGVFGYSVSALDAELDAREDPELWDLDKEEAEEMCDFEEAHAPGGPPVGALMTRVRKAATECTPITLPWERRCPRPLWLHALLGELRRWQQGRQHHRRLHQRLQRNGSKMHEHTLEKETCEKRKR